MNVGFGQNFYPHVTLKLHVCLVQFSSSIGRIHVVNFDIHYILPTTFTIFRHLRWNDSAISCHVRTLLLVVIVALWEVMGLGESSQFLDEYCFKKEHSQPEVPSWQQQHRQWPVG